MMNEDDDLERRAVEELLRETTRARARAETMGPAGWLKCPVRSTNKRFLLNTLRSTALHRRPGGRPSPRSPPDGQRRSEESERERTGSTRHQEGKERCRKTDSIKERSPPRRQSSHRHSPKDGSARPVSPRRTASPRRTRSRSPVQHGSSSSIPVNKHSNRTNHK